MPDLPEDLIADILSRLPVKSLLRFRCVSKIWCDLIDSFYFTHTHLIRSIETNTNRSLIIKDCDNYNFHSVDLDSLDSLEKLNINSEGFKTEVLGSCNGLLCLYNKENGIVLWNPSTLKSRKLPDSPIEAPQGVSVDQMVFYGFGYEYNSDDYKLLRILQFKIVNNEHVLESQVEVYSLKSNSWRRVHDFPPSLALGHHEHKDGVLKNGALHWVGTLRTELDVSELMIIAFDFETEKFRFVPQPDYSYKALHMRVDVFCGYLSLLICCSLGYFDMWVLKDYGVKESWKKVVSFAKLDKTLFSKHFKPIATKSSGEVLLELYNQRLVWFVPENKKYNDIKICGMPECFEANLCLRSLVQLDGDGGSDEKQHRAQENKERKRIVAGRMGAAITFRKL